MSRQFRRVSLGEQVADDLREQILTGEIEPATHLHEMSLADSFGVSRNTVREALRMLEAEDLVDYVPHKGVVVTEVTDVEIDDLYRARMVIELFAVQHATTSDNGSRADIETALEQLVLASKQGHPPSLVEADLNFHHSLVKLIGSAHVLDFHKGIIAKIRRALVIISSTTGEASDPSPLVEEHEAIFAALFHEHDTELARTLLQEHIEENRELALTLFKSNS